MTDLRLDGMAVYPAGSIDPDRDAEILDWSNGWKTVTFLEVPPEEDLTPAEAMPAPKPLSYADLLALARDGLQVSAADAFALLSKYRGVCAQLGAVSSLPLNSPVWQANMGRLLNQTFAISREEST